MRSVGPEKKPSASAGAWVPYVPEAKTPWNLRRVVHLHRRAGFAATWGEIQRDLKDGPHKSIERLLTGKACARGVPENFEQTAALLGESAASLRDPARLKAWWVYRMLFGPDPLTERLTLMWHDHFATSNLKVGDLAAMRRQNDTFRELARAPFGKLLDRAVREPALLVWLDAQVNRKGHPNENLARELMELFTLGIGHYSEKDVKEAARALTGWSVDDDGSAREVPARHDDGVKTLFGKSGRWTGADLIKILLEQPATADAWPGLGRQFMGEGATDAAALKELAAGLRERNLDVGWGVAMVLRSRAFFADKNLGRRVVGPVEYVIGAARRWSCSIRPRARWCWPSGRGGWGRTCSTRPTSAAGRAAAPG